MFLYSKIIIYLGNINNRKTHNFEHKLNNEIIGECKIAKNQDLKAWDPSEKSDQISSMYSSNHSSSAITQLKCHCK